MPSYNMIKKAIIYALREVFGKYIVGINSKSLQVAAWSGDIQLENLSLSDTALAELDLPIRISHASISTFRVHIPWSRLKSESICVDVGGVSILAVPREDEHWNHEALQETLKRAKNELLVMLQKQEGLSTCLPNDDANRAEKGEAANMPVFFARLCARIVDNMKVTVSRIHVRLEDSISSLRPFALGLAVQQAELSAVNTSGKKAFIRREKEKTKSSEQEGVLVPLYRLIEFQKFQVYWDDSHRWISHEQDASIIRATMDGAFEGMREKNIILSMPSLNILHHGGKGDITEKFIFSANEATVQMQHEQYIDLAFLARSSVRRSRLSPVLCFRPKASVHEVPKLWWRYAAKCIIFQLDMDTRKKIGKMKRTRERSDLRHVALEFLNRTRYMSLYKRLCELSQTSFTQISSVPPPVAHHSMSSRSSDAETIASIRGKLEQKLEEMELSGNLTVADVLLLRSIARGSFAVSGSEGRQTVVTNKEQDSSWKDLGVADDDNSRVEDDLTKQSFVLGYKEEEDDDWETLSFDGEGETSYHIDERISNITAELVASAATVEGWQAFRASLHDNDSAGTNTGENSVQVSFQIHHVNILLFQEDGGEDGPDKPGAVSSDESAEQGLMIELSAKVAGSFVIIDRTKDFSKGSEDELAGRRSLKGSITAQKFKVQKDGKMRWSSRSLPLLIRKLKSAGQQNSDDHDFPSAIAVDQEEENEEIELQISIALESVGKVNKAAEVSVPIKSILVERKKGRQLRGSVSISIADPFLLTLDAGQARQIVDFFKIPDWVNVRPLQFRNSTISASLEWSLHVPHSSSSPTSLQNQSVKLYLPGPIEDTADISVTVQVLQLLLYSGPRTNKEMNHDDKSGILIDAVGLSLCKQHDRTGAPWLHPDILNHAEEESESSQTLLMGESLVVTMKQAKVSLLSCITTLSRPSNESQSVQPCIALDDVAVKVHQIPVTVDKIATSLHNAERKNCSSGAGKVLGVDVHFSAVTVEVPGYNTIYKMEKEMQAWIDAFKSVSSSLHSSLKVSQPDSFLREPTLPTVGNLMSSHSASDTSLSSREVARLQFRMEMLILSYRAKHEVTTSGRVKDFEQCKTLELLLTNAILHIGLGEQGNDILTASLAVDKISVNSSIRQSWDRPIFTPLGLPSLSSSAQGPLLEVVSAPSELSTDFQVLKFGHRRRHDGVANLCKFVSLNLPVVRVKVTAPAFLHAIDSISEIIESVAQTLKSMKEPAKSTDSTVPECNFEWSTQSMTLDIQILISSAIDKSLVLSLKNFGIGSICYPLQSDLHLEESRELAAARRQGTTRKQSKCSMSNADADAPDFKPPAELNFLELSSLRLFSGEASKQQNDGNIIQPNTILSVDQARVEMVWSEAWALHNIDPHKKSSNATSGRRLAINIKQPQLYLNVDHLLRDPLCISSAWLQYLSDRLRAWMQNGQEPVIVKAQHSATAENSKHNAHSRGHLFPHLLLSVSIQNPLVSLSSLLSSAVLSNSANKEADIIAIMWGTEAITMNGRPEDKIDVQQNATSILQKEVVWAQYETRIRISPMYIGTNLPGLGPLSATAARGPTRREEEGAKVWWLTENTLEMVSCSTLMESIAPSEGPLPFKTGEGTVVSYSLDEATDAAHDRLQRQEIKTLLACKDICVAVDMSAIRVAADVVSAVIETLSNFSIPLSSLRLLFASIFPLSGRQSALKVAHEALQRVLSGAGSSRSSLRSQGRLELAVETFRLRISDAEYAGEVILTVLGFAFKQGWKYSPVKASEYPNIEGGIAVNTFLSVEVRSFSVSEVSTQCPLVRSNSLITMAEQKAETIGQRSESQNEGEKAFVLAHQMGKSMALKIAGLSCFIKLETIICLQEMLGRMSSMKYPNVSSGRDDIWLSVMSSSMATEELDILLENCQFFFSTEVGPTLSSEPHRAITTYLANWDRGAFVGSFNTFSLAGQAVIEGIYRANSIGASPLTFVWQDSEDCSLNSKCGNFTRRLSTLEWWRKTSRLQINFEMQTDIISQSDRFDDDNLGTSGAVTIAHSISSSSKRHLFRLSASPFILNSSFTDMQVWVDWATDGTILAERLRGKSLIGTAIGTAQNGANLLENVLDLHEEMDCETKIVYEVEFLDGPMGIVIGTPDVLGSGAVLVHKVTAQGQADRLGVRVGDILEALDGNDVRGMSAKELTEVFAALPRPTFVKFRRASLDFGQSGRSDILAARSISQDASESISKKCSSFVVDVNIDRLQIVMFNDYEGRNTPLLRVDVRDTSLLLSDQPSNEGAGPQSFSLQSTVSLDCFNFSSNSWTPCMYPVSALVMYKTRTLVEHENISESQVRKSISKPQHLDVSLDIATGIEMSLSDQTLNSLLQALSSWRAPPAAPVPRHDKSNRKSGDLTDEALQKNILEYYSELHQQDNSESSLHSKSVCCCTLIRNETGIELKVCDLRANKLQKWTSDVAKQGSWPPASLLPSGKILSLASIPSSECNSVELQSHVALFVSNLSEPIMVPLQTVGKQLHVRDYNATSSSQIDDACLPQQVTLVVESRMVSGRLNIVIRSTVQVRNFSLMPIQVAAMISKKPLSTSLSLQLVDCIPVGGILTVPVTISETADAVVLRPHTELGIEEMEYQWSTYFPVRTQAFKVSKCYKFEHRKDSSESHNEPAVRSVNHILCRSTGESLLPSVALDIEMEICAGVATLTVSPTYTLVNLLPFSILYKAEDVQANSKDAAGSFQGKLLPGEEIPLVFSFHPSFSSICSGAIANMQFRCADLHQQYRPPQNNLQQDGPRGGQALWTLPVSIPAGLKRPEEKVNTVQLFTPNGVGSVGVKVSFSVTPSDGLLLELFADWCIINRSELPLTMLCGPGGPAVSDSAGSRSAEMLQRQQKERERPITRRIKWPNIGVLDANGCSDNGDLQIQIENAVPSPLIPIKVPSSSIVSLYSQDRQRQWELCVAAEPGPWKLRRTTFITLSSRYYVFNDLSDTIVVRYLDTSVSSASLSVGLNDSVMASDVSVKPMSHSPLYPPTLASLSNAKRVGNQRRELCSAVVFAIVSSATRDCLWSEAIEIDREGEQDFSVAYIPSSDSTMQQEEADISVKRVRAIVRSTSTGAFHLIFSETREEKKLVPDIRNGEKGVFDENSKRQSITPSLVLTIDIPCVSVSIKQMKVDNSASVDETGRELLILKMHDLLLTHKASLDRLQLTARIGLVRIEDKVAQSIFGTCFSSDPKDLYSNAASSSSSREGESFLSFNCEWKVLQPSARSTSKSTRSSSLNSGQRSLKQLRAAQLLRQKSSSDSFSAGIIKNKSLVIVMNEFSVEMQPFGVFLDEALVNSLVTFVEECLSSTHWAMSDALRPSSTLSSQAIISARGSPTPAQFYLMMKDEGDEWTSGGDISIVSTSASTFLRWWQGGSRSSFVTGPRNSMTRAASRPPALSHSTESVFIDLKHFKISRVQAIVSYVPSPSAKQSILREMMKLGGFASLFASRTAFHLKNASLGLPELSLSPRKAYVASLLSLVGREYAQRMKNAAFALVRSVDFRPGKLEVHEEAAGFVRRLLSREDLIREYQQAFNSLDPPVSQLSSVSSAGQQQIAVQDGGEWHFHQMIRRMVFDFESNHSESKAARKCLAICITNWSSRPLNVTVVARKASECHILPNTTLAPSVGNFSILPWSIGQSTVVFCWGKSQQFFQSTDILVSIRSEAFRAEISNLTESLHIFRPFSGTFVKQYRHFWSSCLFLIIQDDNANMQASGADSAKEEVSVYSQDTTQDFFDDASAHSSQNSSRNLQVPVVAESDDSAVASNSAGPSSTSPMAELMAPSSALSATASMEQSAQTETKAYPTSEASPAVSQYDVIFGKGRLGLTLQGRPPAVVAFTTNADGSLGQAAASNKISIGDILVAIEGERIPLTMPVETLLRWLQTTSRPCALTFQGKL